MAERTPGPWRFTRDEIGKRTGTISKEDGSEVITNVEYWIKDANARLIAAAPEMLEELEWAHSQLCPHPDWCDANHPVEWPKHNAIRATIAKAKGE